MKIIFTRRPPKYSVDTNFYLTFSESESGSKNIMNSLNFSMKDEEKQLIINSGYQQGKSQIYSIIEKIFFSQLKTNKLKLNIKSKNLLPKEHFSLNEINEIKKNKYHEI